MLLAVGVAHAQQPAAASSKAGSITGRVVNESGQPIQDARILVMAVGSNRMGEPAMTDRDGIFKVTGLEPVPYRVAASKPAYIITEPDPAKQYKIGDSVTFVLTKGGVITGTVTNSTGDPVIGVGLSAIMVRDGNGRPSRAVAGVASTDDRGVYRIYGIQTGSYIIVAGGSRDYSGTGVSAFSHDIPTYAPSSSRDTAEEISVRAGQESTNVNISYRGEKGRTISGNVIGPNAERGFNVYLTSIAPSGAQSNTSTFEQPGTREFAFTGVTDGDYYVTLVSYSQSGLNSLSESKFIRVRGLDVEGVDLSPVPMGQVSARVVLEESKAPECKDKAPPLFSEISVSAWHRETAAARNQPQFIWGLGQPASPDAQGNVSLKNLPPGQYYFVARFPARSWYPQSIAFAPSTTMGKPRDTTRVWTTIKTGDRLSGLTITLAQGAASFRGKLVLPEGETNPEKWLVYLVPVETERATDLLRFYGAHVRPDGKIVLLNLAPGRYWVLAQPASESSPAPLTKFRVPDETETRARLRRDAEAAKMEVELKPCTGVDEFQVPLALSRRSHAKAQRRALETR